MLLHEFGHVLKLGHSPNENDVMCGCGEWNPYISENDKFVLRLVYSIGSGVRYSECEKDIEKRVNDYLKTRRHDFLKKQGAHNYIKTQNKIAPKYMLKTLESIEEIIKYKMSIQNIALNRNIQKQFIKPVYFTKGDLTPMLPVKNA